MRRLGVRFFFFERNASDQDKVHNKSSNNKIYTASKTYKIMQFRTLNSALDTRTQTSSKNKQNAVSPRTYFKVRKFDRCKIQPIRGAGNPGLGPAPNRNHFQLNPLLKFQFFGPGQAQGRFEGFGTPPDRALETTRSGRPDPTE